MIFCCINKFTKMSRSSDKENENQEVLLTSNNNNWEHMFLWVFLWDDEFLDLINCKNKIHMKIKFWKIGKYYFK